MWRSNWFKDSPWLLLFSFEQYCQKSQQLSQSLWHLKLEKMMKVSWSCLTQKLLLYMFKSNSITNSYVYLLLDPCRGLDSKHSFANTVQVFGWSLFSLQKCYAVTVGLLSAESQRLCSIASKSMGCPHPSSGLQTCCEGICFLATVCVPATWESWVCVLWMCSP